MKRGLFLTVPTLALLALAPTTKADTPVTQGPVNPYVETDGDGVPLSVTMPKTIMMSADDVAVLRKEQAKAEANKNWLVKGYEKQLKARAAADPKNDLSDNIYYQLSKNKDLAKLAGLPPADDDDAKAAPTVRTEEPAAKPNPDALRRDAPSAAPTPLFKDTFAYKPFLSSTSLAGQHDFYASLQMGTPSPNGGSSSNAETPAATPARSSSNAKARMPEEPTDIETPGMIAAEKDPLSNIDSRDLTLDVLPGQTPEQAKAIRDSNNSLELPTPMTVEKLHKQETPVLPSALSANGVIPTAQPATPATLKKVDSAPEDDPNAPLPVSKELPIMPVHGPIASPLDILNR